MDVSKQGIGQLFAHGFNMIFAIYLNDQTKNVGSHSTLSTTQARHPAYNQLRPSLWSCVRLLAICGTIHQESSCAWYAVCFVTDTIVGGLVSFLLLKFVGSSFVFLSLAHPHVFFILTSSLLSVSSCSFINEPKFSMQSALQGGRPRMSTAARKSNSLASMEKVITFPYPSQQQPKQ